MTIKIFSHYKEVNISLIKIKSKNTLILYKKQTLLN